VKLSSVLRLWLIFAAVIVINNRAFGPKHPTIWFSVGTT
jgi:hypothetical protein